MGLRSPGNLTYEVNENGCWLCTSHSLNSAGYPQVTIRGKSTSAHRYVYAAVHGDIEDDQVVRHTCDVKRCINPDHLVVGTHGDNVRDAVDRNRRRYVQGTANGRAKLTDEQVGYIKEHNTESIVGLAEMFGVSPQLVSNIQRGRARSGIPGPVRPSRR